MGRLAYLIDQQNCQATGMHGGKFREVIDFGIDYDPLFREYLSLVNVPSE